MRANWRRNKLVNRPSNYCGVTDGEAAADVCGDVSGSPGRCFFLCSLLRVSVGAPAGEAKTDALAVGEVAGVVVSNRSFFLSGRSCFRMSFCASRSSFVPMGRPNAAGVALGVKTGGADVGGVI
jgi:hypothetical protein